MMGVFVDSKDIVTAEMFVCVYCSLGPQICTSPGLSFDSKLSSEGVFGMVSALGHQNSAIKHLVRLLFAF
jgi:hypothetical protein